MAVKETRDVRGPAVQSTLTGKADKAEVSTPNTALAAMLEELTIINTLLGGTLAMRDARHAYLPQHEYESTKNYNARVEGTTLDNFVGKTLNNLVGRAFREPPQPTTETDENLVDFMSDVDGAGTGFIPFTREWFRQGVRAAVAYCLIDMPYRDIDEEGKASKAEDAMPVWQLIPAEDMLDYREGRRPDGSIGPTLIRYRDDYVEEVGDFGTQLVQCVRIIRLTDWEEWTCKPGPRGGKGKWERSASGAHSMNLVPVVPFYTDKTGVGEGRPVLADQAHLNIRHWQSTSDQNNILTVCRFPILAGSGVGDLDDIVVGPKKLLSTKDPQGKFYWVEHEGAAIEAGDKDLQNLEQAMSSYGAQFMKAGAQGPETASGRILDDAEATSPLQSWGLDFKDAMELALYYTAYLLGMGDEVDTSLLFDIDASVGVLNDLELQSIEKARERKDISRPAYINELKRRNILDEDYDVEADQETIDEEAPPPGSGLEGMNTRLAGPNTPQNNPEE